MDICTESREQVDYLETWRYALKKGGMKVNEARTCTCISLNKIVIPGVKYPKATDCTQQR